MSHNVDKPRTSWHEVKPYHRGFESEVRYRRSPDRNARSSLWSSLASVHLGSGVDIGGCSAKTLRAERVREGDSFYRVARRGSRKGRAVAPSGGTPQAWRNLASRKSSGAS